MSNLPLSGSLNVVMVGTGYVGLVSGVCFSEFGHNVTCVDLDQSKVDKLNAGEVPIYEAGLKRMMDANAAAGRLKFTTSMDAVKSADAVFIAVGTPSRRGDGHADLGYVFAAAEDIAKNLEGFTVVVTKSTVPVGTGQRVKDLVARANPNADFAVASNPEFLREGAAINDFMKPDRVVIGCEDERAEQVLRTLYSPLYLLETPIQVASIETAELIKYAANAFLAMKITFINEMADLCEKVGGHIDDVAKGMGLDKRIGSKFLHTGPGYGGSCFPKDTKALMLTARKAEAPIELIETTVRLNEERKENMANRILSALGENPSGKTVAVFGLTFKPETDDMRDSPSLTIIPILQEAGVKVQGYDPKGMTECEKHIPDMTYCASWKMAAKGADIAVILTEWHEFRALDLAALKKLLKQPTLLDFRNIYQPEMVEAQGFTYQSLGRGVKQPLAELLKDEAA